MKKIFLGRSQGGVAMEYLVVSLLTLGMSITVVKIVKNTIREKLKTYESRLGISGMEDQLDEFSDDKG